MKHERFKKMQKALFLVQYTTQQYEQFIKNNHLVFSKDAVFQWLDQVRYNFTVCIAYE